MKEASKKICRCGHSYEVHNGFMKLEERVFAPEGLGCNAKRENGLDCECEEFEELEN